MTCKANKLTSIHIEPLTVIEGILSTCGQQPT